MTARTVYDTKDILLQDDREVTLKPLPIALLKKLMKAWEKVADVKTEDDFLVVYIHCSGICLSRQLQDDFEKTINANGTLAEDYKAYLEENLDLETIFEILDVCGGIKLNEENLTAAVAEMEAQATPGT